MVDLNEVLDKSGFGKYQVLQLVLLAGISLSDGAEVVVASCVLSSLQTAWNLSPVLKGAMMSIIFLGVLVGNLVGGGLADALGRRRAVLCSYTGMVVFGLLTACAQGPYTMLPARFVFGIFFGMGVGPGVALQVETAPATWRGHLVNLGNINFTLGEVLAATLFLVVMPDLKEGGGATDDGRWRVVTVLALVPGMLILPLCALLLQESPHYLLVRGRHEEAFLAVKHIAEMNGSTEALELLSAAAAEAGKGQAPKLSLPVLSEHSALNDTGAGGEPLSPCSPGSPSAPGTGLPLSERLAAAVGPEFRGLVLGGAYICFLSNFLFYGLTYALPQIFAALGKEMSPSFQVLVVSLCDLPGVLLAAFLISSKVFGHRDGLNMLAGCCAVLVLALSMIDRGKEWLWLALPAAYLSKYAASTFFTLSYVYLAEVFPSACRCTALSLSMAGGRIGSMCAPLLFETLVLRDFPLGLHFPFMLLSSVMCIVAIIVIHNLLTFELKNEPLEDLPRKSKRQSGSKRRPSLSSAAY